MHNIKIEKIVSAEVLHQCARILVDAYNSEPWNDEWSFEKALQKLECFYNTPNFLGLAAYRNNELVGACVGNMEPYYSGDYFYLKEMFVSPISQKLGVGNELMSILKMHLAEFGIEQMILFTSNAFFPCQFYEKSGFTIMTGMVMMHFDIEKTNIS